MKRFSDFITEEVVPAALVQNGSIDIDKEEVRASINMALAKVTADGVVTPYIALNRIQKALAYFHIILPKKVYLDGAKGVEVHELRQFGHKMGMTNDGEFVHEVPGKYFLFMQYAMNTPMVHGGQKAWPMMGGTFRVMAKVVDQVELDRLVSMAELALAEDYMDAEAQQGKAKACAPRDPMHDITSDEKKKGNKEAVAASEKGLDEEQIDEIKVSTAYSYAGKKMEKERKGLLPGDHNPTSKTELKNMRNAAERTDKDYYKKRGFKKIEEEQIDELDQKTMLSYKSAAKDDRRVTKAIIKKGSDTEGRWKRVAKKRKIGLKLVKKRLGEEQIDEMKGIKSKSAYNRATKQSAAYKMRKKKQPATPRKEKTNDTTGQLQEKAPPGAKFERMVKHIKAGYAKDGLTAKEKGIAYATAWKAKKRESKD